MFYSRKWQIHGDFELWFRQPIDAKFNISDAVTCVPESNHREWYKFAVFSFTVKGRGQIRNNDYLFRYWIGLMRPTVSSRLAFNLIRMNETPPKTVSQNIYQILVVSVGLRAPHLLELPQPIRWHVSHFMFAHKWTSNQLIESLSVCVCVSLPILNR